MKKAASGQPFLHSFFIWDDVVLVFTFIRRSGTMEKRIAHGPKKAGYGKAGV